MKKLIAPTLAIILAILNMGLLRRQAETRAPRNDSELKTKLFTHSSLRPVAMKLTEEKVKFSIKKTNPDNPLLYHKTTHRDLYDKERIKAIKEGFFEVIFLNTKGEVTEGSITNIFIQKNKKLYTPALKCGLLPGVLRQHLLNEGKAREKVICLEDVLAADKVFVGNSVRGLVEAKLEEKMY